MFTRKANETNRKPAQRDIGEPYVRRRAHD
jgi:hypothetical protein